MTKEYQKPELVDLKNSRAEGACTGGSSPVQDCTSGETAAAYCTNGTSPGPMPTPPGGCTAGTVVASCVYGNNP
ncbi:MAG: hypothetical protein HZC48_13250 [Nitrospirae bacterium]|nr:hypothetical protein [Nitrospirota bacterium]